MRCAPRQLDAGVRRRTVSAMQVVCAGALLALSGTARAQQGVDGAPSADSEVSAEPDGAHTANEPRHQYRAPEPTDPDRTHTANEPRHQYRASEPTDPDRTHTANERDEPRPEEPAAEPSERCAEPGPIDAGALYRRHRSSFVVLRCQGERYGTGFGFGPPGRVATARHVVTCPRGLAAELADGTIAPVRVVAMSDEHDIALVELSGPAAARVPPLLPDLDRVPVGAEVVSVGFPVGPEGDGAYDLAVTRGIVAERTLDRLVHDALVSPGSSGGPLLDRHGRVVGVTFAVPRGSSVGLAVPVEHLVALSHETPRDAGDPRDPFQFGFDVGLSYTIAGPYPSHFVGLQLALWGAVFDQFVATLRGIASIRLPQTLADGGTQLGGNRFAAEADVGYRLRIDGFPIFFELAGGISVGNDHVSRTNQELMLTNPSCDPTMSRCAVSTYGVTHDSDRILTRPLLTLRATYGPLTLAYTVLFDVESIDATAHRITLRLGIF